MNWVFTTFHTKQTSMIKADLLFAKPQSWMESYLMLTFDGIKTSNTSIPFYLLEGQYTFEYLSTAYAYYNFH